ALATRTPVICTPVGSIPEVLDDGRTALFVAPGDEAGIAVAILALADDRTIGKRLSDGGGALYPRLLTMQAFARAIGVLYARLTPNAEPMSRTVTRRRRASDD